MLYKEGAEAAKLSLLDAGRTAGVNRESNTTNANAWDPLHACVRRVWLAIAARSAASRPQRELWWSFSRSVPRMQAGNLSFVLFLLSVLFRVVRAAGKATAGKPWPVLFGGRVVPCCSVA